jgi:hypothetical protein
MGGAAPSASLTGVQYGKHNAGNANHVSVEYLSTYKVLGYHMSTKLFEARTEGSG